MSENQGLTWVSDPVMRGELRRLLDARTLLWSEDPEEAVRKVEEAFAAFWRHEMAWQRLKEKADGHS